MHNSAGLPVPGVHDVPPNPPTHPRGHYPPSLYIAYVQSQEQDRGPKYQRSACAWGELWGVLFPGEKNKDKGEATPRLSACDLLYLPLLFRRDIILRELKLVTTT